MILMETYVYSSGMIIGYIIGIALLELLTYKVAVAKNRKKVLWMVLSFLFGLIPVIILACLPKVEDGNNQNNNQNNNQDFRQY